ncbi:MAG: hypothetical protein JMN27_07955 [gamma proteobacterium endosymbiont of Lamellibrachia anaximandri]|nr:hypothetical protein [gamma proteobacterium endosymbiont of Lamellibrachia anaximandri]MBL3533749.1 hypothetical protein [gamma proteobacterium endosymbiont of Lamellibrachia anaximandri]
MDWKATAIGFVSTVIVGLVIQLIYVLVAALIGAYGFHSPWLSEYKEVFWLGGATLAFAITMLMGGAITVAVARSSRLINPVVACTLAGLVSLMTSLDYSHLQWLSLVYLLMSGVFSAIGGKIVLSRSIRT